MYLDEVTVGMEIELPDVRIDRERLTAFAQDYDPIPLHLDETYAKSTRFGGLIAPGVMSFMSVWANFAEMDIFGEALIAGKSTKIEWLKPVYPEDVLSGKCVISNVTRRNAYNGIAAISLDIYNQHGECVLTSVTESVVKYRPHP